MSRRQTQTAAVVRAEEVQGTFRRLMIMAGAGALVLSLFVMLAGPAKAAGSGSYSDSGGSSESYGQSMKGISKNMRKAQGLISTGEYAGALGYLEAELKDKPESADAWNLTGFASRKMGDYARSEAAYDKALALDPKHKGALEYKGELYLTLGNLAGAEGLLARLNAQCSFNCTERDKLKKAIADYKAAN